jgi:hypothetical protein
MTTSSSSRNRTEEYDARVRAGYDAPANDLSIELHPVHHLRRLGPVARPRRIRHRPRLRGADARPARSDPGSLERPRRAWTSSDGHRQDGGICAADAPAHRRRRRRLRHHQGSRPRSDPRARDAGRRGDPQVCERHGHARRARLRRRADGSANSRLEASSQHRRRHAGTSAGSHQPADAEAPAREGRDAGRGRRDARHGICRRPRGDPPGDAARAANGALLGSWPSRSATFAIRNTSPSPEKKRDPASWLG